MKIFKILPLFFVFCFFTGYAKAQVITAEDSLQTTVSSTGPVSIGGNEPEFDFNNPKEYEIGPVRIEGADNFDHNAIRLIAGLRQGQTIMIPGDKISKAIQNLWNEELFSEVEIYADKEVAGVIYLVIAVTPRPKLSRFKFAGVTKKDADKIRKEISLFSGKTISENLLYSTEAKIRGYYREKGNYGVKIDIKREPDSLMNNSEIFLINVKPGKKVGIGEINFEGNKSLSDAKLRKAMKDTKRKSILRIFKRSKFSESAYDRDKKNVIDKFNSIGLRDATIEFDTVYQKNEKNLVINIKIDEGNKYYFGNIEWLGNTKYRSSYLDTVLGIKYGDVYNKSLLDQRLNMSQDGRDISSLYMDRGYLFFQVHAVEKSIKDNHISYQMRIIEGKEAIVRNIFIKGNNKTNENVIRREIRTKPGDLFNRNDIIRTQRELAQLGYFNEQGFQINPMPNPQDGTVDIEYVVEEKSSDQIELSGGYGAGRLIGTLGLTFNNFSLRNMVNGSEWSPLPSGDGQRLSLRGQTNGKYYQGYNFSFTEPWLGGKKPNSLSFWMNHTAYSSNGLSKRKAAYQGVGITGVGLGFGRRKKVPDDYFSVYYELSYQYYDVGNFDLFADFNNGYSNDISFKYLLQRNSVNVPIYPSEGSQLTFMYKTSIPYSLFSSVKDYSGYTRQEQLKYLEYFKVKFTGTWYFPLTPDKKLVIMPRIGFGFLGAYNQSKGISPFERYVMGGSGMTGMNMFAGRELIALRGYEDASVSAQTGDPLVAKYTLELRYPISLNPSATFYVLGFAEAGNTYPTFAKFNPFNVKRSAGVGLRVFLPMFGMLGIDYGWGFDKLDPNAYGYGGASDTSVGQKGYYGKLTFTIGMNMGEL